MTRTSFSEDAAHDVVVYTDSSTLSHTLTSQLDVLNGATLVRPISALGDLTLEKNFSRVGEIVVDLRDEATEAELPALRDRMAGQNKRIIGFGDDATLGCYRRAKQAGCDEYFSIDQELSMMIDYIVRQDHADRPGHVVVHGVKPGIGASLIAAGLAHVLSARQCVEIVEMNWTRPTINYWLGEDQTGEMHRLTGLGNRMDSLMANQIVLSLDHSLLYYGGYDMTGGNRFDAADAARFYDVLGTSNFHTIWKTDKGNPELSDHVLRNAEHVVLVSDRSLSSLRSLKDLMAGYREAGREPVIVVNDPYAESDLKAAKFRTLLQSETAIFIPRISRLKAQLLDGIPPGSPRSKLRRHLQKIAAQLDPEFKPVTMWRRWRR